VFYFEQLFQTALQGIDGTSIMTTVLELAGSLLVLSFLYVAYQAFAAGATCAVSLLPGLNTWYSDWCLPLFSDFPQCQRDVQLGCRFRLQRVWGWRCIPKVAQPAFKLCWPEWILVSLGSS